LDWRRSARLGARLWRRQEERKRADRGSRAREVDRQNRPARLGDARYGVAGEEKTPRTRQAAMHHARLSPAEALDVLRARWQRSVGADGPDLLAGVCAAVDHVDGAVHERQRGCGTRATRPAHRGGAPATWVCDAASG